MHASILVQCAECGGAVDDRTFKCRSCNHELNRDDGVLQLTSNQPGSLNQEISDQDIVHLLAQENVEVAVRQFLRTSAGADDWGYQLLGRSGGGWRFLLPVDHQSVILCLNPAMGLVPLGLAGFVKHVVVYSDSLQQLRWVRMRAKKQGIDNLKLVYGGGSRRSIPFLDSVFDAVVVGRPEIRVSAPIVFLNECGRVLKTGGCLFEMFRNRYGWRSWMTSKLHVRSQHPGRRKYRRMLESCGFGSTRFYIPCPADERPTRMIDSDDKVQLTQAFTRKEFTTFRRFRQKVKGFLSFRFPDAFGMLASDLNRSSFLDRLLTYVRFKTGDSANAGSSRCTYRINDEMGIVTVIAREPGEPFVLKLPIHDRGLQELKAETQILKEVHEEAGHPLSNLSQLFATVRSHGEFGRQSYFAHSLLAGVSGDHIPASPRLFDTVVRNAATFLAQLHLKSPDLQVILEDLVQPVRHDVLSLTTNVTQRDTVNRVADRILETFADTFSGAVWAHGDSKIANFMFDPMSGNLTGVIDWGTGFQPELPGYDLSFLLVSSEASRTRTGVPDQLLQQYRSGLPQHVCEHLTSFAATTDLPLDDSQYQAMIGYQWMKRLAPLATEYETMRFNHHYIDRMFDAVAE